MCQGVTLRYQCSRCRGVVLLDNTKYRQACPQARARNGVCGHDRTRWSVRRLQAGTDINPRESLTDPRKGSGLLRWNEFHCIQCELHDEILRLNIHADSPELELDAGVGEMGDESDEYEPLVAWSTANQREVEQSSDASTVRNPLRWFPLLPSDGPSDMKSNFVAEIFPQSGEFSDTWLRGSDSTQEQVSEEDEEESSDDDEEGGVSLSALYDSDDED
ncbi:hypothetical protein JX265_011457 [Neoarthrinium moseri]|uniref:Uncharacterized protein n=1 Tax=Neoarthrinium moseri TaxID=1658444 RepID=A0A9Q0AJP2_9PEZI|nr:hypothetical protein JX266_001882 [Neoarthrinium moseri]KAI1856816.1 hypothetical protein JX265_011457 [Neoarthrinium moseri]